MDAAHHVSVPLGAIEDAPAIREAAVRGGQVHKSPRLAVERAYRDDSLRNLLPIGAHVLYRRAAHRARDTGKTLYPRKTGGDGIGDQPVPVLSGRGRDDRPAVLPGGGDPAHGDAQDEAGKAGVGN